MQLYEHKIQLIELTKLLEREVCDSMTVTNYIGHNYEDGNFIIDGVEDPNTATFNLREWKYVNALRFNAMYGNGTQFSVPLIYLRTTDNYHTAFATTCTVTTPSGVQTTLATNITPTSSAINYTPTEVGEYKFEFTATDDLYDDYKITFTCSCATNINRGETHTITSVINRLLSAGVTRRDGLDAQKYVFDTAQAEKFSTVAAPEFFFTRSTLFEALLQVGAYIHGIPRLTVVEDEQGNEIDTVKFDMLGGDDVKEVTVPYVFEDVIQNVDDFCGSVDSHVDNLLNSRDKTQGAISEPSAGTFKTIRCDAGSVEISEKSMIIFSEKPIYQIIHLGVSFKNGDNLVTATITPYVYESAEYGTLSSYAGSVYPYSKAYAITYAQGDNKITGLNFKQTGQTTVSSAFDNIAIRNIIQAATGIDVGSNFNYTELAFQITYIPIVSTRITQRKPYPVAHYRNALIYNQGANTNECELYGEKLKGTVARLGQPVVRRTYDFTNYSDIPKCGQKVNINGTMMYVAMVEREFDIHRIRATVTYTKDFNKLAEYVAINSNFRLYDVSEKQSVDRFVNYGEQIVVSEGYTPLITKANTPMLTDTGMTAFMNVFRQDTTQGSNTVAAAVSQGFSSGNALGQRALAALSFASGNSLCFAYGYEDNFGAGYQSSNKYESDNFKRVQKLVSYGDVYGELDNLAVKYVNKLWTPTLGAQTDDTGAAQIYPEYASTPSVALLDTGSYPLIVKKDSRERLGIMVQEHFIGADERIVIGPALGQNNPLVTAPQSTKAAKCYVLFNEINMLNSIIDVSNAVEFDYLVYKASATQWAAAVTTEHVAGKSIVWVDPTNNRLLVGINKPTSGATQTTTLTFKAYSNNAYEEAYNLY